MTTSRMITNEDIERNILAIARLDRERRGVGPADVVISRTMTAEERLAMENRDTRRPMERLLAQPKPGPGVRTPVVDAVAQLAAGPEIPAQPERPVVAAAPKRATRSRAASGTSRTPAVVPAVSEASAVTGADAPTQVPV